MKHITRLSFLKKIGIVAAGLFTIPRLAKSNTNWTVVQGTGIATINSTGLLTALTDGTVTVMAMANDGSGVFGTAEITISNQIATNIIPHTYHDMKIYPNPATDVFNILIDDDIVPKVMKIVDFSGRVILAKNNLQKGIITTEIPSYIKSGIYIVTLESTTAILYTGKLIIKR